MTPDTFRAPVWSLAATLAERLAARRTTTPTGPPADPRRAAARLQRWRGQHPFGDEAVFQRRLATDQLTEAELLHLLGEPVEAVAAYTGRPAWLGELEQGFAHQESWPPAALPAEWRDADQPDFLDAVAPLLARGRQRVRDGARTLASRYPSCPFDPDAAEEILLDSLLGHLHRMLARTLVLELNVARLRGQLSGETAEERFASFVRGLCRADAVVSLLRDYPVLARQVVLCISRWEAFSLEFLGHLAADWDAVAELLPGGDPGPLDAVEGNAGDTHRGGRAVLIARFRSGGRVVYKPKALAADRHFQELLAWVNRHAEDLPPFPTYRIVDQGAYGWVEFVEAAGCATEAEVRRFYRRQGGYLALLYALEGCDFHSENLIAAGEYPVLLDLEALFHSRIEVRKAVRASEVAAQTLDFSVLRVGLLPQRVWARGESEGLDVSGLGATGGQLSPYRVPLMEDVGTDSMRLVRRRIETLPDRNRPTLAGAGVTLADYAADVVAGFEGVYRLLLARRDELLAPGGRVAEFAGDVVRVIVRETRTYTLLLNESYHPDVLRDALDRDRLLDRLWAGIAENPYLARVIPAERADLLRGDIPMFTTRAGSRDLWTSDGERVPDFFTASGMELVEQRLRGLSEDDLARQRWIIRASLATAARSHPEQQGATSPRTVTPKPGEGGPPLSARLLNEAAAVGSRLDALALRGQRGATWLGLSLRAHRHWTLEPLGFDLADGLPGVALFLAYLGHVTGEARYTTLAQAAVVPLQEAGPPGELQGGIGVLEGWGGVIYALAHLGTLWDRPALLVGAKQIAAGLAGLIDRDEALVVASGAGGCLAGLLALYQASPSEAVLAAAQRCGERLLVEAAKITRRSGFAYGSAGVAWALLELASRTGDERFREAALRDLSTPETEPPGEFSRSWCHGAAGTGLALLRAWRGRENPELRGPIEAALRATQAGGTSGDHTLCHGDLGNLELLSQAGEVLGDRYWQDQAARRTGALLDSIREHGWRCAAPLGVETPGLMTGLAGIGLGLLRLAEPGRVPAVLVFAPPG